MRQLTVDGFFRGCSYGLLGVGFALILGVTGRFHFAYGFTYTLAAYMAFTFTFRVDLPFWPAAVLGVLLAALVGASIERFVYRPLAANAGPNALLAVFVAALGLGIAGDNLIRLFWGSETQAYFGPTKKAYHVWDTDLPQLRRVAGGQRDRHHARCSPLMLRYTALGRQIKATRVNPDLARRSASTPTATYVICFFLGTICAGVAAFWYALKFTVDPAMGTRRSSTPSSSPSSAGTARSPIRVFVTGHRRRAHRAVLVDLALRAVDADGRVRRARRLPHRSGRRARARSCARFRRPRCSEGLTMELWLNYLDQILLYADAGAVAEPAARLRRAGLGGARRVRRHRRLRDGATRSLDPRLELPARHAARHGAGVRHRQLVALPALKLTVEYLILLTLAVSSVILGLLIATPSMGGTYGLIDLPAANLFGWHLQRAARLGAPVARRDGDRVRDLPPHR